MYSLAENYLKVSAQQLKKDLGARFTIAQADIKKKLQTYMDQGARFAITTDYQSGPNKVEYIAVTVYQKDRTIKTYLTILDIVPLLDPIYNIEYLSRIIMLILKDYSITTSVLAVVQDNASVIDKCVKVLETKIS